MHYKLENEFLRVEFDSIGGELQSIQGKDTGYEYLWQGNPDFWRNRSPVLFPIVGKLNNGKYRFEDAEYTMDMHGFAKTMEFQRSRSDQNSITFVLTHNDLTLESYPFKFLLSVSYTLRSKALQVTYHVSNQGNGEMWFSIGGHPGFNCEVTQEGRKSCRLIFSKMEDINYLMNENGILTGEQRPFLRKQNVLDLSALDFDGKTRVYILNGLKSNAVTLENYETNRKVEVIFGGFPYLGIWSPKNKVPLVCLEPWYGIGCTIGVEDILEQKRGIQKLNANQTFTCDYEMIFY